MTALCSDSEGCENLQSLLILKSMSRRLGQTNPSVASCPFICVTGVTQFRLRFGKEEDNDYGADLLKFYSGNAVVANQPQLIIEYSVP